MVPRLSQMRLSYFMLYAACLMPYRPSQLRLGQNRSFYSYFIQIIRGRLVRDWFLIIWSMVMVLYLMCFCIPRPVCPSLAKINLGPYQVNYFISFVQILHILLVLPILVYRGQQYCFGSFIRFTILSHCRGQMAIKPGVKYFISYTLHSFIVLISYHAYAL